MTTSMYDSLSHSKWDCKYHVVFVPKYRKKKMYGERRAFLREAFRELALQKGCEIISGSLVQDHVHMLIRIPQFSGCTRNFNGEKFWARGYAVSTVGYDQESIKAYINKQEQLDGQQVDEDGNV